MPIPTTFGPPAKGRKPSPAPAPTGTITLPSRFPDLPTLSKPVGASGTPSAMPPPDKMMMAQDAVKQAYGAQAQRYSDLESAIRNRPAVPPELQDQYSQMQSLGRQITGAPIKAPAREISGMRGGLQTLGMMLNQSRNPQTGQVDMLGAGIGALLAQLLGNKQKIGEGVAQMYDQPGLDADNQRMMGRYDAQNKILQSQLPFTRSAQDNDVEARKVGLQAGQMGISSARDQESMAMDQEKLARDRYQYHFDPTTGTILGFDKMRPGLALAQQIRNGGGPMRKPDDVRQDAAFMDRTIGESFKGVDARDKIIADATMKSKLADKLEQGVSQADPELAQIDPEILKDTQKRQEKVAQLRAEAEAGWQQADAMANSIVSQGNQFGYQPFSTQPWKQGSYWPQGHVGLNWSNDIIQMMRNKSFGGGGDSALTQHYGVTR